MRVFYRYVKTPYKTIITNNFEGRCYNAVPPSLLLVTAVSGIPERFYVAIEPFLPLSPRCQPVL